MCKGFVGGACLFIVLLLAEDALCAAADVRAPYELKQSQISVDCEDVVTASSPRVEALPRVIPFVDPDVNEHEVIVRYKRTNGQCCAVFWDIYGFAYDESRSLEDVLESYLLRGNRHNRFYSQEIPFMLKNFLKYCLTHKERVSFGVVGALPLKEKDINDMLFWPEKAWEVDCFPHGSVFSPGEVRISFTRGTLTSKDVLEEPAAILRKSCVFRHCRLYAQRQEERSHTFQKKLYALAQEEKIRLDTGALEDSRIFIKYFAPHGGVCGVEWSNESPGQQDFALFLRTMVLQGTSVGVWDEKVRHFAFENDEIFRALRQDLVPDLTSGRGIVECGGLRPLSPGDVCSMPRFFWNVVPNGEPKRHHKRSCFIRFGVFALEGVPCVVPVVFRGKLSQRSFLWALERDNVREGVCPKMLWGGI